MQRETNMVRTSLSLDQLINDTIVDGEVVNGRLILRSRGGAEIDAGSVIAPMPVGSVYMTVSQEHPATLLGGDFWVPLGQESILGTLVYVWKRTA
jgi:hypothetical protein